MTADVDVLLLGSISVAGPGGQPVPIAGPKLQALVAMLALATPHAVSTDRIIDELWGDEQPVNPANALQAQISQLRRVLGRDTVIRRESGYRLAVDPDRVDATRLERLVREGREAAVASDQPLAADRFEAALAMLRGPPLGDLADYRFARVAATRLEELALAAHEGLADALLATGRHAEVVTTLTDVVREHPLRERFHAQLILALYQGGRQADALRAYQVARDVLIEELGLEPGAELQALERGVLAHDPALSSGLPSGRKLPERTPLPGERDLEAWRTGAAPDDLATERLPLIGREAELRALHADVAATMGGRGRVALVGGEPGIGKTRLAEELTAHASTLGAVVVWSRCYEGRGAPAFWPWTQIVHSVLSRFASSELRAALGSDAAELAQIAPEIKEHVAVLEPVTQLDPESARFRVYQAVVGFLGRLAASQRIVVVIDDLQWADASSMELLSVLAPAVGDTHLLVVVTYRNVDPTITGDLSRTLAALARHSTVRRVELEGLDDEGLAQFLSAAGAEPSEELLDTVQRRTRGNPFFVTEILRLLPARGGLPDARHVGRVVPSGVGGVIRQRIARLPDETSRTLTAASVLGQDFELGVVASMVDADSAEILDRLEPAVLAGVLVDSPEGVGRYRFCHGLVTETVYDDMGAAQRARLHLRAAEALEARDVNPDGPQLIALAAHWYRAVPAAPPDKGIDYAVRSAQWAQAHVAHQQAEDQLRAALDLVAGLPDRRDRAGRELAIQDQLSGLLIVTKGYSTPGVADACARMRELCRSIDDNALLLPSLWRLTIFHCVRLELDTAVALGEQLLELARPEGDPGLLLAGHMALGCANTQLGRFVVAQQHLDEAMDLLAAGHDRAIGAVLETPGVWARVFSAWNVWMLGDEERADQLALDAVAAGDLDGPHSYGTTFATWFTVLIATLSQQADVGLKRSEAGMPAAVAAGYGMFVPMMGAAHGWAVAAMGDPAAGGSEMDQMCAAMEGAGVRMLRHFWLALRADIELMAARYDDALAVIDEGLANVEATNERWYEAELHRLRGEALVGGSRSGARTEAESEFRQAVTIAVDQGAGGLRRRAEANLASL